MLPDEGRQLGVAGRARVLHGERERNVGRLVGRAGDDLELVVGRLVGRAHDNRLLEPGEGKGDLRDGEGRRVREAAAERDLALLAEVPAERGGGERSGDCAPRRSEIAGGTYLTARRLRGLGPRDLLSSERKRS